MTAGAICAPAWAGLRLPRERRIELFHTHTGESLEVAYWRDGDYDLDALNRLNHLLRDHRSGESHPIDPKLFDLLHRLREQAGGGCFEVISGYRSPGTNAMLRNRSSGVAKRSLHMQGRAIDLRLDGCRLRDLRDLALGLEGGGVGYYPESRFIHVDTGRVRSW